MHNSSPPTKRLRLRLSFVGESVDVKDGAKVVKLVEASKVERLPDVTLHGLSITNEAVGAV